MKTAYSSDLIFALLFIIFGSLYYSGMLSDGPHNMHVWRQTDCLSLTQMYAEGNGLFEPEMHIQLGDEMNSGKSAGEFPIIYYVTGQIWKLVGQSYLTFRLLYLIILFMGTFSLYRLVRGLLGSGLWGIVISLLVFTSPAYAFYGVSFLTDVPAMCFTFSGLYMIYLYRKKELSRYFVFAMFLFALGGLIKISSLIAFIFLLFVFCVELFTKVKSLGQKRLFRKPKVESIGFVAVLLIIFSWYFYASIYNETHGFKYTFNNIYPYWIMSSDESKTVLEGIKNTTSHLFFSRPVLWLLLLSVIYNLTLWNRIPFIAYASSIVISLGFVLYLLLWFPLLGVHDYYFAAGVIILPAILIPAILGIQSTQFDLLNNWRSKFIIGAFLIFNLIYCENIMSLKTSLTERKYWLVGNAKLINDLQWTSYDNQTNIKRYERMRSYLTSIGVDKEDKVISLPDPSFSSTLFLMNRKGWTHFLSIEKNDRIDKYIEKGAEFLVVGSDELLDDNNLKPYLKNQVGTFEGIHIFKL